MAIFGLLVFGFFVVVKATVAAYRVVSDFSPLTAAVEIFGEDLKKDENGYTNILLLGAGDSGDGQRAGANLIDSIMVASIDYDKKIVSMLSIPRDYYVTSDLNLGLDTTGKINQVYSDHSNLPEGERFEIFKSAVGELVDLDLQYFMRIDFKGFVEIVDGLGGITVEVPEDIYDPSYPNSTDTGTIVFQMEAGLQDLDGETALKYARTRHSARGDYDRSARQQLILDAIRQKALSSDVLTSPSKLKDVYDAISDNFDTDLNFGEITSLAGFAKELESSGIIRKQLHNDKYSDGGFLYDGLRSIYGGAVVLPYGDDLELIHQYTDLLFNHREIYANPATIKILNATKYGGIAGGLSDDLRRFGFIVEDTGNYIDDVGERQYLEESYVEYYDWLEAPDGTVTVIHQSTLEALTQFIQDSSKPSINAFKVPSDPENPSDEILYEGNNIHLTIVLGEDYETFLKN